jgi:hypothetical protein
MVFKLIVVILLVGIIASLGSALFHFVREPHGSERMAKSLTWRIGLSLVLFILLMIGFASGWIQPHGIAG